MPKIIGIMASTENGVIGKGNALPWNYEKELNNFRNVTHNQIMVMGGKTFESSPPGLFKQKPIVFSKTRQSSDLCAVVSSVEEFLAYSADVHCSEIFMIGGAKIAELFLDHGLISEFILTKIHKDYAGDTVMNLRLFDTWHQTIIEKTNDYTIYKLNKNTGDRYDIY